ncbi:MAG: hypothetical protein Tsb0020_51870 [Haliangiales bacterium]
MDHALRDQIRYLALRSAACERQPALHREQLAAYAEQLAMARAAADLSEYDQALQRRGATLAVARAEWLDRYAAMRSLYRALGADALAESAQINYQAGQSAPGTSDFSAHIVAGKHRATPTRIAAESAAAAVPSLIAATLDWVTEPDPDFKADYHRAVVTLWATLRAHDPACTWQRVCEHRPYRDRVPFGDAGLALIGGWLRDVVGAAACDEPAAVSALASASMPKSAPIPAPATASGTALAPDAVPAVPSAAEIARGYHLAYQAGVADDPAAADVRAVYEQIFALEAKAASGPALVAAMAERGLFCQLARAPHIAAAERAIVRAAALAQPHLAAHYRRFIERLAGCPSPTAIEYEVERHSQYLAVEGAWHDLVLRCVNDAVIRALTFDLDDCALHREGARNSHQLVCRLLGESPAEIIETSHVASFFDTMLALCRAPSDPDEVLGAAAGEAGMALRPRLRGALAARANAGRAPIADAAGLREVLVEIAGRLGADAAPRPNAGPSLHMWGAAVGVDELAAVAQAPPRPIGEPDGQ